MRVIVLGGTVFIGRAIVEDLVGAGHDVLVVHRGLHEPEDLPAVEHLHVARAELSGHRPGLAAFGADALVDCRALTREEARQALDAVPDVRLVVLSSGDVYRAFGTILDESPVATDPLPLSESAPVRERRYPYRGRREGMEDYDKLDVEEEYLARGATALRLPMTYGAHDGQRREEYLLRRVRAGRSRIPMGAGSWRAAAGSVWEVARAVRLALGRDGVAGEAFNVSEAATEPVEVRARQILDAAGSDAELVHVPEAALPADLEATGTIAQHLVYDVTKAREVLGWVHADPLPQIARSVAWHLVNPPEDPDPDFSADDRALAANSPD